MVLIADFCLPTSACFAPFICFSFPLLWIRYLLLLAFLCIHVDSTWFQLFISCSFSLTKLQINPNFRFCTPPSLITFLGSYQAFRKSNPQLDISRPEIFHAWKKPLLQQFGSLVTGGQSFQSTTWCSSGCHWHKIFNCKNESLKSSCGILVFVYFHTVAICSYPTLASNFKLALAVLLQAKYLMVVRKFLWSCSLYSNFVGWHQHWPFRGNASKHWSLLDFNYLQVQFQPSWPCVNCSSITLPLLEMSWKTMTFQEFHTALRLDVWWFPWWQIQISGGRWIRRVPWGPASHCNPFAFSSSDALRRCQVNWAGFACCRRKRVLYKRELMTLQTRRKMGNGTLAVTSTCDKPTLFSIWAISSSRFYKKS